MSNQVLNWAVDVAVGSAPRKAVLMALANRANDDGICWPGIARLMLDTELCERTVYEQIAQLEERGLISRLRRGGGGDGRKSNVYKVLFASNLQDTHPSKESNLQDTHLQPAGGAVQPAGGAPKPSLIPKGEPSSNVNSLPEMSITIPLKDGTHYRPERKDILRWRKTYPTLDLCEHLNKIADWNEVNEGRRKTLRGVRKHISTWLGNVGRPPPWQQDDVDPNSGRHQAFPCD